MANNKEVTTGAGKAGHVQDDFDLKPVAAALRQGPASMAFVFFAWCCTLNHALVGAAIGTQATFTTALWACVVACIIYIALGIPQGIIGQRTGLTTGMLCRYSFGIKGSKVGTSIAAIAMWGWMCFDMWTGAAVVMALFDAAGINRIAGWVLGAILMASIAAFGAYKGITGIKWISWTTTPIAIILFIILIVASVRAGGGMEVIMQYQPPVSAPFFIVVNVALGSWINGTTLYNDMTRMCKDGKTVAVAVVSGICMAFVLLMLGFVGMMGTGAYGIAALGISLGGALFYVTEFFTLIAMGNTVPGTDYVISQGWSSVFARNRKPFCIIVPLVGVIIGTLIEFVFGIASIQTFVNFLATFMPPIMGVMMADFYVVNKGHYGPVEELTVQFSASGLIALAAGAAVSGYFTFVAHTGLPALFGIIVSFVLLIILKKGAKLS